MADTSPVRSQELAISDGIAALYRSHYGRGPSQTRTVVDGPYAVCFLSDIFTPMERTLLEAGREDVVREVRHAFQHARRADYVATVERAVGRRVIAFMSQIHFDPDMSVEAFVLETG